MDRIEKFLQQLTKKDRRQMLAILADIVKLSLGKYDVKPLKGYKGVYRLRKRNIRVVFAKVEGKGVLIDVSYRADIYRGLK